jgi:drug/metabolite transporter (DMT)-like permease
MSAERRAMAWMTVFALLWVVVEVLGAHLSQRYSGYQVVWTRYAVHLVFMMLIFGWREPRALWHTKRPVFHVMRSLLMLTMPAAVIVAQADGVDIDTVMAVFWAAPLLIIALARVCLKERTVRQMWLAGATAFLGAVVLLAHHTVLTIDAWWLPLLSAVSFSLYVVMTRMLRHEDVRTNLFYTALGVCAALTPLMPRLWIAPSSVDVAWLCGIGVAGLAALYALDRTAEAAPVSGSAAFGALQAAFAVGVRVLHNGQGPGLRAWVGLLLIAAATGWMWIRPDAVTEAPVL